MFGSYCPMSAAQVVPVLLALLAADLVAQGKPPENSVFSCAMHPQVLIPEKGVCPICGMDLVPFPKKIQIPPGGKKIQIPPGGLRAYCENYVEEALQDRQRVFGDAFFLVEAHVELRGKDWRKKLRGLLEVARQDCLSTVAFHLGRLQDHESIPLLKKLLADDELVISEKHYCSEHGEVTADASGACRKCGKPLFFTLANLLEQLCIAGALHEMGVAEGLFALEEIAKKPFGHQALSAMALRDSPRVRRSLAAAAKSEDEHRRSAAVSAQLRLGLGENFQEAVRLLANSEPEVRGTVIFGLGESGMERAIEPLKGIARDGGLPRRDRVLAARALVKLGEQKYLGFLMDAFHKTASTDDCVSVYWALGEVGDESVLPLLETAIENDGANRGLAVAAAAKILGREAAKADKK